MNVKLKTGMRTQNVLIRDKCRRSTLNLTIKALHDRYMSGFCRYRKEGGYVSPFPSFLGSFLSKYP